MSVKEQTTNGLKLLIKDVKPFAQVQASWRFLNNESVKIEDLNQPIKEALDAGIKKECEEYLLAMSDWSHIDYKHHRSKKELVSKNKKASCKQIGYDLQTTLAVSDVTGEPIAPIVHNLKTDKQVYSNYDYNIPIESSHLEELGSRVKAIKGTLQTNKKIVHIVDRESDSVAFMRELQKSNTLFLLRVKTNGSLYLPKEKVSIKQGELANQLELGKYVKSIQYQNKKVKIYVNECLAHTLALWYYYRWKIETYFKLLKSSGFNLEQWQQEEPMALFRRLLVVSLSCVLVWKIANENTQNAKVIREFLVQLSGRQIGRGKEFTHPALFAGLQSFLQITDVILLYSPEELLDMKQKIIDLIGLEL